MGRSPSTVSRELRRNGHERRRYAAPRAQERYLQRRKRCVRRPKLGPHVPLTAYVRDKLLEDWSPEQIAGTLAREHPGNPAMRVSHETIYAYVYKEKRNGGKLFEHLRQAHRRRRRRANLRGKRGRIVGRVPIDKRPKMVNARKRTGDWEGDTVFGQGHRKALVTALERKTGFLMAQKVNDKTADTVARALIELFDGIPPSFRKTLTLDNGLEFARFNAVEDARGLRVFFAHPYSAWERGANENINGLLRQYLPKKTDFRDLSPEQLQAYVDKLNNRPRKRLGYRTPAQAFAKARVALHS
jgi:IS30 family transposase